MISLGRRDARKELGLGFGGGTEMEDTELEEGEACSDHNNNIDIVDNDNISNNNDDDDDGDDGFDASIDPDVALSYIDVKLQDVLGHFQKDFEGGVSAENLGAKFGGYGSFLPTYQRSPVWSHPRTPPKNQNYNAPRSPNNSQPEGTRRGSLSSSTVAQLVRPEPASASMVSLTASRASSSPFVAVKQEAGIPSSDLSKECAPRNESMNRKLSNIPDQKLLKVRIKVGSDNLSAQKNAAIYSGLGLDVSPSSSLEYSPSGSEGMSHGPQDSLFESPAHILQIMTSFPVCGGLLLSPLPDDLINLTEKVNGLVKGVGKILGEKKISSLERIEISAEPTNENNKESLAGVNVLPKKEECLDTLACEDLISSTLKLPLLSNLYPVTDSVKGTARSSNISKEVSNGVVRDKGFSDVIKDEPLQPMSIYEDTWIGNSKATAAGKNWDWEDKKASSLEAVPLHPRKDGHRKGEKPYGSVKGDSNISKGKKTTSSELMDGLKQKADQKVPSNEQEGTNFPSGKDRLSSDGKKKLKGSQIQANIIADALKDGLASGPSSVAKSKKSASSDEYIIRGELEDLKSQKNTGKTGDMYKEFFGDLEPDQEENQMCAPEIRQKDSDIGEKSARFCNATLKEKLSGKKSDRLPTIELHPKTTQSIFPNSGNGLISDVTPVAAAPAATEDSWVCCDKCQKWRLLPLGKNPNDLPEKWLCSMLNWLPNMNRCSFSEVETTNALMALNQALAPNNLPTIPGGAISSVPMVGDQLVQNHLNFGSHAMPSGGKKKTSKGGTTMLSNSVKKSIPTSMTNGSFNEANQPVASEPDFRKLIKTADLTVEKHKNRQKEKHKVLDSCSDGGDTRKSKMKGKRDHDEDLVRVSKKIRAEGLQEDWISDHTNIEKVGPSSANGLPSMSSGKNLPKDNGRTSSKDQVSARKSKDKVPLSLDDVPSSMGKLDDREVGKKRKMKGSYDTQGNTMGHNLQDSRIMAKEEFSDNEYRKEKKARVSRSDGKESSASKGSGKTDRKAYKKNLQVGKNIGSSVSQRSLDGADFSKRDSGSLHPSVAATSSSSKVSGSHKTKANFHETKGSPVESVSSSPLRVSKHSKLISGQRNFVEKDDSSDAGILALGSRRKCSDGEDDGGSDRSAAAKKEKILEVAHHGSHESSVLDIQEKDFSRVSGGKAKQQIVPSPDITNHPMANGSSDYLGPDHRYSSKTTSDRCDDNSRQHENHYANGSRPRKSGKGSSSRSKDKNRNFNYELDNGKGKVSDSINEEAPSFEVKPTGGRSRNEEKFGARSDESENRHVDGKDSVGLLSSESIKKERQLRIHGGSDSKADAICNHDATSVPKQSLLLDSEAASRRGKSPSLPPSGGAQNETVSHCSQPVSGSQKGNGANALVSNASDDDNPSKILKQNRKTDPPNGTHQNSSRDPLSNGRRTKDLDVPSPAKRDSSSQGAATALKEAKNLKHTADRIQKDGLDVDSVRLYFEAALKFLYAASLLESGDPPHAMHIYSSTANLCQFCAHEYEKSKDMALAALAYKCVEVAYMRVIFASHNAANKDRHELQTALHTVPPGESPSSSASDVDNLNHPAADKGTMAKNISSPQVTGCHVIAARKRPNFVRLLSFTQDVHFAMEASNKSKVAFAKANASLGETQRREGISSIKAALDFNFQDVQGLLRLVRLAVEAISR